MRFWGAFVFGLCGAAFLLALGVWQIQRLNWKQGVLADISTRISAAPVSVPQMPDPVGDLYLPVTAKAAFDPAPVRVLVSQKLYGAGYRLIHGATLSDGRRVLVDRGFVSVLVLDMPAAPVGTVEITGNLHWPSEVDGFTPDNDLKANIWFARDVSKLAAHLGTDPLLIIARAVEGDEKMQPLPVGVDGIPNDHLQYAVTWFLLCAIWVGMGAYFLYRNRRPAS